MIRNLVFHKVLWLLAAAFSFITAFSGLIHPGIYSKVVSVRMMPGILSQDLVTCLAALTLLYFILTTKEGDAKKQMAVLGILGYMFYGYGIYVIERIYNAFYLIYMAVFGLSLYAVVYFITGIRIREGLTLSNGMKNWALGFLTSIPLLFGALWIGQLIPLMRTGQKLEFTYSIYILDLCFVMPACAIIAVKTAKKDALGLLLAPVFFIKGFSVLFPVGLGEFFKPLYHLTADRGGLFFYLGLSGVFLTMTFIYMRNLKIPVNS